MDTLSFLTNEIQIIDGDGNENDNDDSSHSSEVHVKWVSLDNFNFSDQWIRKFKPYNSVWDENSFIYSYTTTWVCF